MLHIKLKGMEHRASHKHIYSVLTHTLYPWGGGGGVGSKDKNNFFLNVVMLHIKLKEKKYSPT